MPRGRRISGTAEANGDMKRDGMCVVAGLAAAEAAQVAAAQATGPAMSREAMAVTGAVPGHVAKVAASRTSVGGKAGTGPTTSVTRPGFAAAKAGLGAANQASGGTVPYTV
jgi:hypothetical protein